MGVTRPVTKTGDMASSRPAGVILLFTIIAVITEAYNIDQNLLEVQRRGYRDPDDPRNLFAAMYGGVFKRSGLSYDDLTPDQLQYLKNLVVKRAPRRMNFRGWSGLKDPYDPRNLFHSIYGGVWKRK